MLSQALKNIKNISDLRRRANRKKSSYEKFSLTPSFSLFSPFPPRQAAAAQYSSDPNNSNSDNNSNPSSSKRKRPYHKRSPCDDEARGQGQAPRTTSQQQPQQPKTTTTMTPPPSEAAAAAAANNKNAAAAAAVDLEPHQKLEAVAARLAASVGDASELVSAARMLQNDGEREKEGKRERPAFFLFLSFLSLTPFLLFSSSRKKKNNKTKTGGVPASVLRQLSLALRQIGSQQANALEEVRRRRESFFFELRESTFPFSSRALSLTFVLSLFSPSLSFHHTRPPPSSTPQPRPGSSSTPAAAAEERTNPTPPMRKPPPQTQTRARSPSRSAAR